MRTHKNLFFNHHLWLLVHSKCILNEDFWGNWSAMQILWINLFKAGPVQNDVIRSLTNTFPKKKLCLGAFEQSTCFLQLLIWFQKSVLQKQRIIFIHCFFYWINYQTWILYRVNISIYVENVKINSVEWMITEMLAQHIVKMFLISN